MNYHNDKSSRFDSNLEIRGTSHREIQSTRNNSMIIRDICELTTVDSTLG